MFFFQYWGISQCWEIEATSIRASRPLSVASIPDIVAVRCSPPVACGRRHRRHRRRRRRHRRCCCCCRGLRVVCRQLQSFAGIDTVVQSSAGLDKTVASGAANICIALPHRQCNGFGSCNHLQASTVSWLSELQSLAAICKHRQCCGFGSCSHLQSSAGIDSVVVL